ncbi:MAG: putative rhamnosyl transferase [Rhodobacteraceae bacterium]|nr:putative rhamnosyl transferase [Paracoccaceae bacterium]
MQVIGLCRFSYPAYGGFQVEHETLKERIRYLYDHDRLEERFRLFETIALPCLKNQTDQDFELIIVIGDSLPKEHVDRLQDQISDLPQARLVAEPPRRQREVMKELLQKARRDPSRPCLQFRHDDDDAISVKFIEKLRTATQDCQGLLKRHQAVTFDFNSGYVAEVGKHGISATPIHRPYDVASLGMHIAGGSKLTIMNFAHNKIVKFMPTVTFSKPPMFVRTHNSYNDSRQKAVKAVPVEPLTPDQQEHFRTDFGIDINHVRRVFSNP